MSCAHTWISPRSGFEVSFKTLSINSLCYNSAERQEPTCLCPPGRSVPSFQLLQSQQETAAVQKTHVFPRPRDMSQGATLIYRVLWHEAVPSSLPFMGAKPAVGAASAPSSCAGKLVP